VIAIVRSTTPPRRRAAKKAALPAKTLPAKETLLALVEKTLDDGKAEEVSVIDLEGKSNIADHMVVATGRSQRQVVALADRLAAALKDAGFGRPSVEGLPFGDWVLIDAGDVVVHLFRPEVRDYYNLEKMWGATFAEAARLAQ
jgi:ribosome-associated protein